MRNIRFFPYPEEVKCSLEKIRNNTQNFDKNTIFDSGRLSFTIKFYIFSNE